MSAVLMTASNEPSDDSRLGGCCTTLFLASAAQDDIFWTERAKAHKKIVFCLVNHVI